MTQQFEMYSEPGMPGDNITDQGAFVLDSYGMEDYNKLDSLWILTLTIFFFAAAVYVALRPPRSRIEK